MFFRALILLGSLALAGHAVADDVASPALQTPARVAEAARQPAAVARPAAGGVPRLSVRGQDIVDPNGNPILLRGWNWGHFGKAMSQDGADNAAQGANAVRLPLRWWGYYKGQGIESRDDAAQGGIGAEQLAKLDDSVRWASQAHLWIILFIDSNCGQNGVQNEQMVTYCDPRGEYKNGHNFWTDPQARARFVNVWKFIANRYKDTPYIGLFEPLPEPGGPGTTPQQIADLYSEVMNVVRPIAPGVPFLVGGEKYRTKAIRSIYNPAWKDVVYTGNLLNGGHELRQRSQELLDMRAQHNVPLFVQQVGVRNGEDPDQSQLRQVLGLLVSNRIGFAYWEYRGAKNPNEYGALFQSKHGKDWQQNQPVLSAISAAFKQR